jgi:P-type Ca2+ transporter type 2C
MPAAGAKDTNAYLLGLSESQAAERLRQEGYNELPSAKPRNLIQIALGVLREPMLLLLLACGGIYFSLGDIKEALVLMSFVFVVIGLTLYQERKTERALDALRDLSSPRALVIRDGERKRIPGRDVVRGDTLVLVEGDRVPADGVLLSATSLSLDESLLTGESLPVRKRARSESDPARVPPGGDDLPFVYSGTLVVRGTGLVIAEATGVRTELGRIGKSLQVIQQEPTSLEQDSSRLIRKVALAAGITCAVLVTAYGLIRQDWLHGFLASLSLAMAILPEELPVILVVFLALGAWRLSRIHVLTRRRAAIETLGAATVLCVDKTGTLTANRMAVRRLSATGASLDISAKPGKLSETYRELAQFAVLASRPDTHDPMDFAIRSFGEAALSDGLPSGLSLAREYPIENGLFAVSEAWTLPDRSGYLIAAKGAPEAIADLCHLDQAATSALLAQVTAMAADGLRVLAVAKSSFNAAQLPASQHDFEFRTLGLIALADPVRESVPEAVRECRTAGIRVVMITGDFPGTAASIARDAGLADDPVAITGPQLAAMSEDALTEQVRTAQIFARMVPEQKLRLVKALKASGEIVAMTGDGVNDAPALKAAHIGIAMGERGTDVAREAADLVLLKDDFSSIVQAVRLGRRIFDNLKKAVTYTFAVHVPIAGLSLVPVLFDWPLILAPAHIAFLELIIDPACSIVFEAEQEEPDIMTRPPRSTTERLFSRQTVFSALLQGAGVLVVLLGIFAVALYRGQGERDARTLTFTTLVLANLCLIFSNRSLHRTRAILASSNAAMWWVASVAMVVLAAVLYVPFLRELFQFSFLHPNDLALCAGAGLASLIWFEAIKPLHKRFTPERSL